MEVTKNNIFEPNDNQRKYLEVFIQQDITDNKTTLAEKTGVRRETIWSWEQNEGFREWFKSKTDEMFSKFIPEIKARVFQRAAEPDAPVPLIELALKIGGEFVPTSKIIFDKESALKAIQEIFE